MLSKKEKYLQLKHDRLNNCGQCLGFRAKGIDPSPGEAQAACAPAVDCHKSCPALGLGGKANQPQGQDTTKSPAVVEAAPAEKTYQIQSCHRCGHTEDQGTLLPCRYQGQSLWVCTRCLPTLIHG